MGWDKAPDVAHLVAGTFRVGGPTVGQPAVGNGVDLNCRSGLGQKACKGCCYKLGWGWGGDGGRTAVICEYPTSFLSQMSSEPFHIEADFLH